MAPQAGFARSNAPEDDLHELERNRPADDPQELEHERLMAKDSRNNIDVAMLEGLKKEFQVQDNGDCVGLDLEEVWQLVLFTSRFSCFIHCHFLIFIAIPSISCILKSTVQGEMRTRARRKPD